MNNPIDAIKLFMSKGGNAQDFIKKAVTNNTNPMVNNLIQMAQKGDEKGIKQFAQNLFKEQGRDFDKEFAQFMSNFK